MSISIQSAWRMVLILQMSFPSILSGSSNFLWKLSTHVEYLLGKAKEPCLRHKKGKETHCHKKAASQAQKFLVLSSKINPTCDNNALIDQEAKRITTQFPCRVKERRNRRPYLVQIRPETVKVPDYMHIPTIPLNTHKFQYKYDAM